MAALDERQIKILKVLKAKQPAQATEILPEVEGGIINLLRDLTILRKLGVVEIKNARWQIANNKQRRLI